MTSRSGALNEEWKLVRDLTDEQLIDAVQNGSVRAFEVIVQRYRPSLVRECHRILSDWQEAEEASQDTLLKAQAALARFEPRGTLRAWLGAIARNSCRDLLRRRTRRLPVSVGGEEACDANDPQRLLLDGDVVIQEAIDLLDPLHAQALRLRLGGFGHDDIATQLGLTPAKVKALLHRARVALRKQYAALEAG